jgi:hypothetical protein
VPTRCGHPEDGDSTFFRIVGPLIYHRSHKPERRPAADERNFKTRSSLAIKRGKSILSSKENEAANIVKKKKKKKPEEDTVLDRRREDKNDKTDGGQLHLVTS